MINHDVAHFCPRWKAVYCYHQVLLKMVRDWYPYEKASLCTTVSATNDAMQNLDTSS